MVKRKTSQKAKKAAAQSLEYYWRNRDKCLARLKVSRKRHKKQRAAYAKEYMKHNKDKKKIWDKTYREKHTQEIRIKEKLHREKDRKEIAAYQKIYRKKHKKENQIYQREYREKNRELYRFRNRRRKASKKAIEGSHTHEEWLEVRNRTKGICPCCKKKVGLKNLTEDHIIPLDWKGTDYIDNIQPLCGSCNSKKGRYHATRYI